MSFVRVVPAGLSVGGKLTSAEFNNLDIDHSKSVDKSAAGDSISGAIVFLTGSSLTVNAGSSLSVSGPTTLSGLVTLAAAMNLDPGVTFNVASGASVNLGSGAELHLQSASTVQFDSGSSVTGTATFASGSALTAVAGSAVSIAGTLAISGAATLTGDIAVGVGGSIVFTAGLLDIGSSAILNIDGGGSITIDSGAIATLAGTLTINPGGQIAHSVRTVSGTYTIDSAAGPLSDEYIVMSNGTGGTVTITMPAANLLMGRKLVIIDGLWNSSSHTIFFNTVGSDTFGIGTGTTTINLASNGAAFRFVSNGLTSWLNC